MPEHTRKQRFELFDRGWLLMIDLLTDVGGGYPDRWVVGIQAEAGELLLSIAEHKPVAIDQAVKVLQRMQRELEELSHL